MADRSMTLRFRADISGYMAGVKRMEQQTKDFGTRVGQTAQQHKKDWDKVGRGMLLAGGAMAAGLGYAVKTAADFDKAMSGVKAVSGSTATEMDKLRAAALKAGADTAFSASDAAKAEAELAKAGVSVTDILHGGLIGSMNLAAAGQIDLADAATISAQAMNIFNLRGKDVGHIADVLTAGANKSAAGVDDLGQALRQGGLVAKQTGFTFDETVATLSAFADSALIGSDAGTSLKTMLQRLTPQSAQAAREMDKLGFSAYDAKGNFIGLPKLAGELQSSFGDLSPKARNAAMAVVFGSDAVRGANVLMKQGEKGIRSYIRAVDDQGAANRMAATQMDNLAGDVEQLRGSLETLFIKQGSAGNDFFRGITQGATNLVNAISGLPDPAQKAIFGITGVTSAALLLGGATMKLIRWGQDSAETLRNLGITSEKAAGKMKTLGKVAAGITAVQIAAAALGQLEPDLDNLGDSMGALQKTFADLDAGHKTRDKLSSLGVGFKDLKKDLNDLTDPSFGRRWKDFDSSLSGYVTFGAFGNKEGSADRRQFLADLKVLDQYLSGLVQQGKPKEAAHQLELMAHAAGLSDAEVKALKKQLPGYADALKGASAASEKHADATRQAKQQLVAVQPPMDAFGNKLVDDKGKAIDARTAIKNLADSIRGLGNTALDASDAQISFQQAIDDARKAANQHRNTLDLDTQAGRDNRQALNQIARSSHDLTAALVENNASQKRVTDSVRAGRRAFIDAAMSMGATRDQARRLADQAGFTKKDIDKVTASLKDVAKQHPKPTVTARTAQANKNINEFRRNINDLHGRTVDVNARFRADSIRGNLRQNEYAKVIPHATGGPIVGPGTGTSDSIPAIGPGGQPYALSNGEHVATAAEVAAAGGHAGFMRLRKALLAGQVQYRAFGGPITPGRMGMDLNRYLDQYIAITGPAFWKKMFASIAAGASGPHMGGSYRTLEAMVAANVPGAIVTSDYRPGATTIYGTPSSHGLGKAVDWAGNMRGVWDFFYPMRGRLHELLGPWGMFRNGRPYYDPVLQAMHENHVHAAVFDKGGWLQPGWNLAYNGLGEKEAYVTGHTAHQFASHRVTTQQAAPAAATAGGTQLVAYIENPWTGEYLEARTVKIADARITRAHTRGNRRV